MKENESRKINEKRSTFEELLIEAKALNARSLNIQETKNIQMPCANKSKITPGLTEEELCKPSKPVSPKLPTEKLETKSLIDNAPSPAVFINHGEQKNNFSEWQIPHISYNAVKPFHERYKRNQIFERDTYEFTVHLRENIKTKYSK
jgi:hypothetical protein